MNLLTKQKETNRLRKRTHGGKVMYTLLYLKWITNKNLLYSTWNSAQCYVLAWMGGALGVEWIHVYEWLSPFTSPKTITTLFIGYTPIQFLFCFVFCPGVKNNNNK